MPSIKTQAFFTGLNTVYFGILGMMIFYGGAVYYLHTIGALHPENADLPSWFGYVNYVLTPVGVALALWVYRRYLSQVDPAATLRGKLGRYQSAIIIRSALLEVPGAFAAVCTFLTDKPVYLAFTGLIAVLMLFWRPTIDSIRFDLQLSDKETAILANPDAEIG